MNAGKLRHRVELQRFIETQNPETGAITREFSSVAKLWAEVVPSSVREFIAAQSEQSEVTGRITLRYRSDITNKDRIVYRGKIYDIIGVLPDPESGIEYLTLAIKEGVSDG